MVGGTNAGEARADDQDVKMFRGCCQGLLLSVRLDEKNIPQRGNPLPLIPLMARIKGIAEITVIARDRKASPTAD
jgi:hypothetical protein